MKRTYFTLGAVLLVALSAVGAANAGFTAYNDCAMSSGGNVTNYQSQNSVASPVYTPSGLLKDYATGAITGVTCTATASGALVMWLDGVVNVPYATGTDAASIFNGKMDFTGSPELNSATEWYQYTFTGLDAGKTYVFATSMNRNGSSYTTRTGKYTLSGAASWANTSSTGTTKSADGLSTTFCNGYNTVNGYVASWTISGSTTFSVKVMQGNPGTKAYGFGEMMLQEIDPVVPEPGSILALGSGLLGLGGFAIRRRSGK